MKKNKKHIKFATIMNLLFTLYILAHPVLLLLMPKKHFIDTMIVLLILDLFVFRVLKMYRQHTDMKLKYKHDAELFQEELKTYDEK